MYEGLRCCDPPRLVAIYQLSMRSDPKLHFPSEDHGTGGLLSFVSYSLASYSPSQAIFDWTYDLWVTSSPNLTNGPQRGDLQVMIWHYYHDHLRSGSMVTLTTLPIWVNGSEVNTPFQVWMGNQGMN